MPSALYELPARALLRLPFIKTEPDCESEGSGELPAVGVATAARVLGDAICGDWIALDGVLTPSLTDPEASPDAAATEDAVWLLCEAGSKAATCEESGAVAAGLSTMEAWCLPSKCAVAGVTTGDRVLVDVRGACFPAEAAALLWLPSVAYGRDGASITAPAACSGVLSSVIATTRCSISDTAAIFMTGLPTLNDSKIAWYSPSWGTTADRLFSSFVSPACGDRTVLYDDLASSPVDPEVVLADWAPFGAPASDRELSEKLNLLTP